MQATLYTDHKDSDIANVFSSAADIATDPQSLIALNPEILISHKSLDTIPFEKLTHLKWLQFTSAGTDKLPQQILDSRVVVTNASGVHPIPIAETVLGYMLSFARNLHTFARTQDQMRWKSEYDLKFSEIHGKSLLVVGMGNIGRKIAQLASAFDMNVSGIASSKKVIDGVESTSLETLSEKVKDADYVVNALPYTKRTHEVFNKEVFDNMKESSIFINIGRGKSVNEKDLIGALKNKKIKGSALDVTYQEPLPKDNPLWQMQNVIITPHISGSTPQYFKRLKEIFLTNLDEYKKDNFPLPTQVDKVKGY